MVCGFATLEHQIKGAPLGSFPAAGACDARELGPRPPGREVRHAPPAARPSIPSGRPGSYFFASVSAAATVGAVVGRPVSFKVACGRSIVWVIRVSLTYLRMFWVKSVPA